MPQSFYMKIEGLEELREDFRRAGANFDPLARQAMIKATTKIKESAKDNIRQNGTTFQGNLARSITVREATAQRGVVAVGESYGAPVEFGRRPGKMPPVAPIERWAKLKLGAPGAGYVIARKIATKGTKAQPYMEPAFVNNADYVLDQFEEAADIMIQMMAGKR